MVVVVVVVSGGAIVVSGGATVVVVVVVVGGTAGTPVAAAETVGLPVPLLVTRNTTEYVVPFTSDEIVKLPEAVRPVEIHVPLPSIS